MAVVAAFTNLVPTSIDTDGSIYNGVGYIEGYRLSSSGGLSSSAQSGTVTTGFMPYEADGVVRMAGVTWGRSSGYHYLSFYSANFAVLGSVNIEADVNNYYNGIVSSATTISIENGVTTFQPVFTDGSNVAYFRVCADGNGADMIVTVNEEITYVTETTTVKARASITLNSVVDIEATYRYYLLQSSTLTKPAKPTVNPPSSSWDDVEPTYTSGSTNSLYYVDLTVFSNGEFSYSEVSLSTAYEAAKEAYNKAVNAQGTADQAQEDIDNLEVGGRNLLRHTETLPIVPIENLNDGITMYLADYGTLVSTEYGIKFSFAGVNNAAISIPLVYDGCINNDEEVTLSFEYRGNITNPGIFYFMQRTSPNVTVTLSNVSSLTVNETDWQKYVATFSHANANARVNYRVLMFYGLSGYTSDNWIEIKAKSLKLEKGNKATDWTPAPEDINNSISDVSKESAEAADANATAINDALLIIDSLKATISTLITGQNGESLMTQTDTGWTFSMKNILDTLSDSSSDIESLNNSLSDVNTQIGTLNSITDDLAEYTEYIEFGTYNGEPCILLGEHDSPFKLRITNTAIQFEEGSTIPAYINSGSMYINKAVIEEELQQGSFAWVARSNGNYGLVWKG